MAASAVNQELVDRAAATYADDLLAVAVELDVRVQELTYSVDQVANGSRGSDPDTHVISIQGAMARTSLRR